MSETNERRETVADIVAALRDAGKSNIEGDLDWTSEEVGQRFLDLADEIEAAAKRELESAKAEALSAGGLIEAMRHGELSKKRPESGGELGQFGNAAAMREVLERVVKWFDDCGWDEAAEKEMDSMIESAKAVLSAPPRNCDVGTAEEQYERYKATGEVFHTLTLTKTLSWAQMPYKAKEGAGK